MPSRNISTADLATVGVYVWTFPAFRQAIENATSRLDVAIDDLDERVVDLWREFTGRLDNVSEHVLDLLVYNVIEQKGGE